jgi:DNA-directed RNA polymerase subunit RPC12/RpoP
MWKKKKDSEAVEHKPIDSICEIDETDSEYAKKRCMTWAALIKSVYEVDPLKCPNCGGRIPSSGISFIEKCQPTIIKKY